MTHILYACKQHGTCKLATHIVKGFCCGITSGCKICQTQNRDSHKEKSGKKQEQNRGARDKTGIARDKTRKVRDKKKGQPVTKHMSGQIPYNHLLNNDSLGVCYLEIDQIIQESKHVGAN